MKEGTAMYYLAATFGWVVGVVVILGILIAGIGFLWSNVANFNRSQALLNAKNQVQINDIKIAQTEQLVKVEQQKAQIRIADAQGIAKAQEIINSSLTPTYLTYLAIQAQQEMATHDHTATIYIPVGNNGVPVIATQPVQGR